MSLNKFSTPQLHTLNADALPLSNLALLQLMQAVLAKGYPFRFQARGWSMVPFIRDGDVIVVTPFHDNKNPKIGEVIAFIHPEVGKLIVHRVIAKQDSAFFIQGDSILEQSDGYVPTNNLLGRVIRVERNGKSIWLGLGFERYLIAWLSRMRLLIPIFRQLSFLLNLVTKKGGYE